jgi:hypothetical protein
MLWSILQIQGKPGCGPPYPLPRSASGRALLKGALARGHVKRSKCKGKNGKKGKGEVVDLIVNIDLVRGLSYLNNSVTAS